MPNPNMREFGGVRYRVEDAIRLGLMSAPAVAGTPRRPVKVDTHPAVSGLITSAVANPVAPAVEAVPEAEEQEEATDPGRPNNGQSKKVWVGYALSVGLTPEQLEGLGRDQIIQAVDAAQGVGD